MTQRLTSHDRVAFPFGCSADEAFDRFCGDGSFDFYDYRSDDERRRSDAFDVSVAGTFASGGIAHAAQAGVLLTRHEARFQALAFNWVGVGTIDGRAVVPPDPALTLPNTDRDERSTELYLRDRVKLDERWSVWAGVRHSRLRRASVLTDGSEPTSVRQSFTTPWLALAHQLTPRTMLYGSWGQGVESAVVPNQPGVYANAGQVLPALKSRQFELGVKHDGEHLDASAALFDIDRPAAEDLGCDALCTRAIDGSARHRGLEALVSWRTGPWRLHASALRLDARRRGSAEPARNGQRPANVPAHTLRLHAERELTQGVALLGALVHEGERRVLPAHAAARVPSWTRVDLGARIAHRAGPALLTWRVGVDNVADRRAWKESPLLFGHAWLYPLPPRAWRLSLQADL